MSKKNNVYQNNTAFNTILCFAAFLSLAVFALIGYQIVLNHSLSIDSQFSGYIISIRNNSLTLIMKSVSFVFSEISVVVISIIIAGCLAVKKKYSTAGFYIVNIAALVLINQVVKHLVKRPRPAESLRLVTETGFSFPSAHSMMSVCICAFLIYIVIQYIRSKPIKIILTVLLAFIPILTGISRIYLGVHYTSDVCAGWLISICWMSAAFFVYLNRSGNKA